MISEAIKALQAGEELKNSAGWKNLQATTGAIISIAGAAFMVLGWVGLDVQITADQTAAIAGGIAGILGVFNTYTTLATSKRVGVSPRGRSDSEPGVDTN